jgi:hypothetical protein
MQHVLAQCTFLEKDQNELHVSNTFSGDDFSESIVKTWLYDFLKSTDTDVFDAARIHESDIYKVIDFVKNCSTTFNVFASKVSKLYDLLDIGLIRFPTKMDPYIKVYRLQLTGLFSGGTFMMIPHTVNRILSANVYSCKYYPRDDLLKYLPREIIQDTLVQLEHVLQ